MIIPPATALVFYSWFVLIAKPKGFYNHFYLTFIQWVLLWFLGKEEDFFFSSSGAFQVTHGRNVNAVKKNKQGSSHLKQLTMENCVLNICNNILTLYPINFYIFYCMFFPSFLYMSELYLYIIPFVAYIYPLHCCVWFRQVCWIRPDVSVSMCVCERMPWTSVKPPFSFISSAICRVS